jgi:ubiquitin conjugation factor E4 B
MEDPIILPTSHMNIDRKTIEEYLLTNPTDPFNRNPLTKEELIPNVELKKRIDDYKLEKIKAIQNKNNKEKEEIHNENENKEDEDFYS